MTSKSVFLTSVFNVWWSPLSQCCVSFSFLVKTCILVAYFIFELSKHKVITYMNENYMFQALEWQSKCKSDQEVDCKKLDDELMLNEAFDEVIKSTTIHLKTFVWLRRHWAWVFWCCCGLSNFFVPQKGLSSFMYYSNPNLNILHLNRNLGQILGFGNF